MPTPEITLKEWFAKYGITPVLRSHGPEDITMLFTTHPRGAAFDRCLLNYLSSSTNKFTTLYLAAEGLANMEEQLDSLLHTLNSSNSSILRSDERVIRDRSYPASPDIDHYEARITKSALKEIVPAEDLQRFIQLAVNLLTPRDLVTYLPGGYPQLQTMNWQWNQTTPPLGHNQQAWNKSRQKWISEAIRHCPILSKRRQDDLALQPTEEMSSSLDLI